MSHGWIKVHREISNSWLWSEPANGASAWIDLLLMANYQSRKIRLGNELVIVERGQNITSISKLADKWGWGRVRTKKFLELLKKDEKISYESNNQFTMITICNYDKYQSTQHNDRSAGDTHDRSTTEQGIDQRPNRQSITNKNDKNYKNEKNEKKPPPLSRSNWFSPLTDDIKRDNRYMLAGRRPLKPYPKIWLTPDEAAQLKALFDEKQLTKTERNLVFQKAVARLTDYEAQGRNLERVGVFNWLTGWVLDSVRPAEPSGQPKRPAPSAYLAPWEQPDFRPGDPAKDLNQQETSND